ncbi:MAG: hypothetical protein LBI62_10335, partial [Candidatus Accumulibacter sp.]|nr:hypothetical protein [Accumulibacter sp.]
MVDGFVFFVHVAGSEMASPQEKWRASPVLSFLIFSVPLCLCASVVDGFVFFVHVAGSEMASPQKKWRASPV